MKILKIIKAIFEDERGIDPITIAAGGAALGGLGGILGAFGKSKQKTVDPLAAERKKFAEFATSRLGQRTPFELDPQFVQEQPGIEAAAEKNIAGRLVAPITAEGITADITGKAFAAQRARQKELFEEEREATANRFNRLGLVSSSPGLKAQSDISERQRISGELLSSDLAVQQIQSQLQALGLQEQFASNTQAQALGLGQTQRGAQVSAQELSLSDIQRQISEELEFGGLASSFLTAQPAQTFFEPSFTQRLGAGLSGAGQGVTNAALLNQLLSTSKPNQAPSQTQSQILGFNTAKFR